MEENKDCLKDCLIYTLERNNNCGRTNGITMVSQIKWLSRTDRPDTFEDYTGVYSASSEMMKPRALFIFNITIEEKNKINRFFKSSKGRKYIDKL